jgi:hypothetical protein
VRLTSWLADAEGLVARIARDLLVRCRELAVQITSLKGSYAAMAASWRPASWPSPAAVLGAAMILSETASATSFRSRHAYARFTGTAPIPLWSGSTVRLITPLAYDLAGVRDRAARLGLP